MYFPCMTLVSPRDAFQLTHIAAMTSHELQLINDYIACGDATTLLLIARED
jgi:hypothetical protein